MAEDRTFTQEEVNKLVGQARLEGKDAGRKEFDGWISPDELAKQTAGLNEQLTGLNDQLCKIFIFNSKGEDLDTSVDFTDDGNVLKYRTTKKLSAGTYYIVSMVDSPGKSAINTVRWQ